VLVSSFWIDVTEVTRDQYAEFLAATGYRPPFVDEPWADDGWNWTGGKPPAGTGDHPVVLVNTWDARAYCAWAGKRLPTEAEWQLAVLGPADDERLFPWGNDYDGSKLNHGKLETPNYDDSDGYERTSPVGAFPAGRSRYGLLDGFGNAWEWTDDVRELSWDGYEGTQANGLLKDPHTSEVGLYEAVRGGAFFFDLRPNPAGERSAFLIELRRKSTGFRCARDA
jgi:serine/threonine-protein kinase